MKRFENVLPRYRIMLVRESEDTFMNYPKFQNSRELFDCFRQEFAALDREYFCMITLDSKNRTIGYHTISIGSLSTSVVHPRECLKAALLDSAAAVVFIHNHPLCGSPHNGCYAEFAIMRRYLRQGPLFQGVSDAGVRTIIGCQEKRALYRWL
jgi:hypothetical protein